MSLLVATAARAPKAAAASVAKKTAKRVWNGPGGSVILKRNQTALPSKFGQRLTTLRVSQPQLLMLYHIEKTGLMFEKDWKVAALAHGLSVRRVLLPHVEVHTRFRRLLVVRELRRHEQLRQLVAVRHLSLRRRREGWVGRSRRATGC